MTSTPQDLTQQNPDYNAPEVQQPASSAQPLDQPLYGASFGQAISRYFKKYATFSGRASRSEYWYVALFTFIVSLIPSIFMTIGVARGIAWADKYQVEVPYGTVDGDDMATYTRGPGGIQSPDSVWIYLGVALLLLITLALIVPNLAITWRRLHDTNRPGPWYFISLVPGVGGIILLILTLLPSKPEGARFDRAGQVS
ncbi:MULTISPECIES: DUF805 domain-containing protein [Micrococcaceae]|uniref:DUF805 domain-containing protein n=1 Tax=Micrococcaceae TaxID=1268 RepID=UPI00103564D4|nr:MULTISPECIES: DUF805 domain-containing protein [Micrococcaceae]TAP25236.1 DUF805 domain-containing protein [Arthrobacter sp. S41]UXN32216.1 DUF805 domain-containing protein [Glutamicibacter sp. M10]